MGSISNHNHTVQTLCMTGVCYADGASLVLRFFMGFWEVALELYPHDFRSPSALGFSILGIHELIMQDSD